MSSGDESAGDFAATLERYIAAGGNSRYDLRDSKRFPKAIESTYFGLRSLIAAQWHPMIGDVCGPEKVRGTWFGQLVGEARRGWRWTKAPPFAYLLWHYGGRTAATDAEWNEIEKAAAKEIRAPWLENRSRVLSDWAGILESGTEHDDFRFRRAVMVRVGQGWGHQHSDTLDLQIFAHGLAMTCDGGQRSGYSKPTDHTTRVHNVVEVDGRDWLGHSWVRDLTDAPGARHLAAEALPPERGLDVSLHRRQVALIDVDDEERTAERPLSPSEAHPNAKLETRKATPRSYVFDVVRVAGGSMHTYCCHGFVNDDFQVNLLNREPGAGEEYLKRFPRDGTKFVGTAPEIVQATWRTAQEQGRLRVGEKLMLKNNFDETAPRKFTRLHVLGQAGARLLQADLYCHQWDYSFTDLFVQRQTAGRLETVFPAIIEPFAGEPFIEDLKSVEIPRNESDARRAVAVEIKTSNGHQDLGFADGRPAQVRQAGRVQVAASFAYYSTDAAGLRQASLTDGTLLKTPEVTLQLAERERSAKVVKADYAERKLWLDAVWPAAVLAGRSLEIGGPGHHTSITVETARDAGDRTEVILRGAADFYLARVLEVDPSKALVNCGLAFPHRSGDPTPGLDQGWVASNEEATKFWRAEYRGGSREESRFTFSLTGNSISPDDFGKSRGFRLWAYGAGDTVRHSTFASLRRIAPTTYELTADSDVTVTLKGTRLQVSRDGKTWTTPATDKTEGYLTAKLSVGELAPLFPGEHLK